MIFFKKDKKYSILQNLFLLSFINYRLTLFLLRNKMWEFDKKLWGNASSACKQHNIKLLVINIDSCFCF